MDYTPLCNKLTRQQIEEGLIEQVNAGKPIILASNRPLPLGHQIPGVTDGLCDGETFDQPFIVIREATFDEWWDSVPEVHRIRGDKSYHRAAAAGTNWFYEVTTD